MDKIKLSSRHLISKIKVKKKIILVSLLISLLPMNAIAMAKKPIPDPGPPILPVDSGGPVEPPPSNADMPAPVGFDLYSKVSYPVGQIVDEKFQSYRELLPQRIDGQGHITDSCDRNVQGNNRFSDRIAYAVELKMHPRKAGLGYVGSSYGMSGDENSYAANSLISHPQCIVDASSLSTTLGSKKVPSAATIKKANEFAIRMNQYRREALNGNTDSYIKASKLWSKLMMCTSYVESLTSANTASSDRIAARNAPPGYRRPASILFYEDPYQNAASRLNIGLFQFTPNSGGNIQACIREWNKIYPSCSIAGNASQAEMIRTVGSSLQTFNAFCGVAKITGTFAVQVNSSKAINTHPSNFVNGKLKSPENRCVSLHFQAGKAYNHFGPFQNTTGSNLEEVLACTLSGEY